MVLVRRLRFNDAFKRELQPQEKTTFRNRIPNTQLCRFSFFTKLYLL